MYLLEQFFGYEQGHMLQGTVDYREKGGKKQIKQKTLKNHQQMEHAFLDLSNQGLDDRSIGGALASVGSKAKDLSTLNLAKNNLTIFPVGLKRMVSLLHLDLSSNKLIGAPEWLKGLEFLKTLDLSGNEALGANARKTSNRKETIELVNALLGLVVSVAPKAPVVVVSNKFAAPECPPGMEPGVSSSSPPPVVTANVRHASAPYIPPAPSKLKVETKAIEASLGAGVTIVPSSFSPPPPILEENVAMSSSSSFVAPPPAPLPNSSPRSTSTKGPDGKWIVDTTPTGPEPVDTEKECAVHRTRHCEKCYTARDIQWTMRRESAKRAEKQQAYIEANKHRPRAQVPCSTCNGTAKVLCAFCRPRGSGCSICKYQPHQKCTSMGCDDGMTWAFTDGKK